MSYKTIQEFFNKHAKHLEPSTKLTKQLKTFRLNWSTKSDEYMDFLGSNLLGVYNIKFSNLDDDMLMVDTLRMKNYAKLQKEIFKVKGIEVNFKIASNIIYQTLTYLIHGYTINKSMKEEDRVAGIKECCLIMQYRMFTSIHSHYFKYNVPEHIATTVYNKLSHKFLIKQLDDWQATFIYRTDNCLDTSSPTYSKFKQYTTKDTVDVISNIQTKIREQIKFIFGVLIDVIESDDTVMLDKGSFAGGDNGETMLKDSGEDLYKYISKMKNIAANSNDFIDKEVIDIVLSLYNNVKFDEVYKMLKYLSDFDKQNIQDVEYAVEHILLNSFTYLQRSDINIEQRENIPKALISVRFYWSSSKVTNEDVIKTKELIRKQVKKIVNKKSSWYVSTLTLVYITYVFLRALK